LLVVAILYLCVLYTGTVNVLYRWGVADVPALALLLIMGTAKGSLFIWLSIAIRRRQYVGWAIAVVAFFLSGQPIAIAVMLSVGSPFVGPVVLLSFYTLALLIILGLLIRARYALKDDPQEQKKGGD